MVAYRGEHELARRGAATIGNFWVDLTRGLIRVLLPIAAIGALTLLAGGVIQNFAGFTEVQMLTGRRSRSPGVRWRSRWRCRRIPT